MRLITPAGILLALIWVVFLDKRIPGNWFIQGILHGVIISIVAALVLSPLVSLAVGEPLGIFYTTTRFPLLTTFAGLIMHLAYGIVLLLCISCTGIQYTN